VRRKVVFSPEARADLLALYDGRDVERALRKSD
jgi:hypothetical protein